jgi:cullin 1
MTELQEGMDMKTYMGLYTAIHNFCTAQKAVGTGTFSTHNRGGGMFPLFFSLVLYLPGWVESMSLYSSRAQLQVYC